MSALGQKRTWAASLDHLSGHDHKVGGFVAAQSAILIVCRDPEHVVLVGSVWHDTAAYSFNLQIGAISLALMFLISVGHQIIFSRRFSRR
jgi:hypothetical protein